MPVSAEMVPGERSKYAEVTEPGRAAEAYFTFELNVWWFAWIKRNNLFTTFYSVCVSRAICEKIQKKNSKI